MASVVEMLGWGGQRFAERHLGWDRKVIRKGAAELESGVRIEDRFCDRGRQRYDEKLPDLLDDIIEIVDPESQTDPTFRSTRMYTKITGEEVRIRLIKTGKYTASELPKARTIRTILNLLGYKPKKPRKCKPLKKIPETDAIFDEVHRINDEADQDPYTLRISTDSKALIKTGEYARKGKSRQPQKALDHDYYPGETITPFCIFLPATEESFIWHATSHVTADFMVDRIDEIFPKLLEQCPGMKRLVINADNGRQSNGRRTQWLVRLIELADKYKVKIQLAYYPPYHSKYNPVERVWGVLENHWGGELLTDLKKIVGLTRSMVYAGIKPIVKTIKTEYELGIKIARKDRPQYEVRLNRKQGLAEWFIEIEPLGNGGI